MFLPILTAIGQGLVAILQFLFLTVLRILLWLLGIVVKRPLQSMVVLLMLVIFVSIHRAGPNNPQAVEGAIRLVLPIALVLVAVILARRFIKLPKL